MQQQRSDPKTDEWQSDERLQDGTDVVIRLLRPQDAALYPDFLTDIRPDDVRLRFLAPMRLLRADLIQKLTRLDPAQAAAFVALEATTGKLLGVARLHFGGGPDGEYAIVVRSPLKGRGLGWLLMTRLVDYARAKGLRQVHGLVLAENAVMLKMCREFGFRIEDEPAEPGVKRVTLPLS